MKYWIFLDKEVASNIALKPIVVVKDYKLTNDNIVITRENMVEGFPEKVNLVILNKQYVLAIMEIKD